MISDAKTVAAYLKDLPSERRSALTELRGVIKRSIPDAAESMKYGMPTYELGGDLCAFASQKGYMALYLCDTATVGKFRSRLGKLDMGKSCIRFRALDQLPLDIVVTMLKESARRIRQRHPGKRGPDRVQPLNRREP